MGKRLTMFLMTLALGAGACFGEDAAALKFYKLDFVVKELDGGKVLNSRSYSAIVSTKPGTSCHIRTNSRLLMPTSSDGTQFGAYDPGVNIDCGNVMDRQNDLSITVTAEVRSVSQDISASSVAARQPVTRENKWDSTVVIPLKKPTVVFSSDDPTSKHQMQLELTATPIP